MHTHHGEQPGLGVLLLEVLVLPRTERQPDVRRRDQGWELTGNLSPYIEKEPVPSPFKKSPPTITI